jgi:curved DNA-binding protein CbpA
MSRATFHKQTTDYYCVLQVNPSASADQIRASFKRLMIQSHPDKNPERRAWSEQRVRELIRAYEILGNPQTREEFDRRYRITLRARGGTAKAQKVHRPFFFHRRDPESRAMLVLHLLVQGKALEAVDVLEEMETQLGSDFLRDNLDRKDYLDCLFLLGEHHLGRREYTEALERLKAFHAHDSKARFRRPYGDQVIDLLKDLYLRKLPRWAGTEAALAGLREVVRLGLNRAEEALRLRKLIELLLVSGDVAGARAAMSGARDVIGASGEFADLVELVEGASSPTRRPRGG